MIEFNAVSMIFGKAIALDRINMDIKENRIYCLLGENGAGKTTFLKLIAGLLKASHGDVIIDGKKTKKLLAPDNVFFVNERENYLNENIRELFKIAADFQDCFDLAFALDMMKKFELDEKKRFKQLSFGMKTMFNTIMGLASTSKIVLLDEPVLGFDAIRRERFYTLLKESAANNPKIIIVSTHLIDEIADVSEEIIIINKGKLLLRKNILGLQEKSYSVTGLKADVEELVQDKNIINTENIGKFKTCYLYDDRILANERVDVSSVGLQDFFINLIKGEKHG